MDYEISTQKSLPRLNDKKKTNHQSLRDNIFRVLFALVFTAVLSVSGQVIYDEVRYSPFVVDGESMYPLLNYDTKITYQDGNIFYDPKNSWNLPEFSNPNNTYLVDYCYMDTTEKTLASLERFDVVVTYYPSDYDTSTNQLRDTATLKVKRVVGLPGETIKLDTDGSLYIKGKGEDDFKLHEQYFLTYDYNKQSRPEVTEDWYKLAMKDTTSGKTITAMLGDDEYYVLGDNRIAGCSLDSRHSDVGPIKSSYLVGKAAAVVMKAQYTPGTDPKKLVNTVKMPWELEML